MDARAVSIDTPPRSATMTATVKLEAHGENDLQIIELNGGGLDCSSNELREQALSCENGSANTEKDESQDDIMLSCCSNAETTQGSDDVAGGVEAVANRDTVAGNNEPESSCTDSSFGGNLFQLIEELKYFRTVHKDSEERLLQMRSKSQELERALEEAQSSLKTFTGRQNEKEKDRQREHDEQMQSMRAEKEKMSSHCAYLEKQMEAMKEELHSAQLLNFELEKKLSDQACQVRQDQTSYSNVLTRLAVLEQRANSLLTQTQESSAILEQVQENVHVIEKRQTQLSYLNQQESSNLEKAHRNLAKATDDIADVRAKLAAATSPSSVAVSAESARIAADYRKELTLRKQLESQLEDNQNENKRLVALLSESHRLVERHQEKATHELQVSAELREELASLDNARAELENAQKQNHNAAEQLTCKLQEDEATISDLQALLASLTTENGRLQESCGKASAACKTVEKHEQDLLAKLNSLEAQLAAAHEKITRMASERLGASTSAGGGGNNTTDESQRMAEETARNGTDCSTVVPDSPEQWPSNITEEKTAKGEVLPPSPRDNIASTPPSAPVYGDPLKDSCSCTSCINSEETTTVKFNITVMPANKRPAAQDHVLESTPKDRSRHSEPDSSTNNIVPNCQGSHDTTMVTSADKEDVHMTATARQSIETCKVPVSKPEAVPSSPEDRMLIIINPTETSDTPTTRNTSTIVKCKASTNGNGINSQYEVQRGNENPEAQYHLQPQFSTGLTVVRSESTTNDGVNAVIPHKLPNSVVLQPEIDCTSTDHSKELPNETSPDKIKDGNMQRAQIKTHDIHMIQQTTVVFSDDSQEEEKVLKENSLPSLLSDSKISRRSLKRKRTISEQEP